MLYRECAFGEESCRGTVGGDYSLVEGSYFLEVVQLRELVQLREMVHLREVVHLQKKNLGR